MRKNVKAIIAALSASIMCAVPVAASFASTTATSITASAAYGDWNNTPDVIADASSASFLGENYVIGNALVYTYNNSDMTATFRGRYNPIKNVVLPDKIRVNGRIYEVTEIGIEANYHSTSLSSFTAGKYLTKIDARAFKESGLSSFVSNAKEITIDNDAFLNCKSLRTVKLPGKSKNGNTNLLEDRAFDGCTALTTVQFYCNDGSNYNTAVYMGRNAFRGCTKLTKCTSDNRRMLNIFNDTFPNINNVNTSGFFVSYR